MMKQTKFWVLLFSVLFVLGIGAFLLLRAVGRVGTVAEIRVDGALYDTIDLEAVTVPYSFDIETEYGSNTVSVSHGEIAITAADCPDRLCVKQGTIESDAIPIVCVPHRLVIQIRNGGDA